MATRSTVGRAGEDAACAFLARCGHEIVERNWRCRAGEIDIVSVDRGELVFTEVKTRSSLRAGDPLEAVTPVKLARMRRLAGLWREAHPMRCARLRLDVVGVLWRPGEAPEIRHVTGVGS